MTIVFSNVLKRLDKELAERDFEGMPYPNVIIPRDHAQYLRDWSVRLIHAKDDMEREIDQLKKEIAQAFNHD